MMVTAASAVLVVGTAIAAAGDVRTRRIPNGLCACVLAAGLAAHVPQGTAAVAGALVAAAAAFAAGLAAFARGWFGGGDVKLLAAGCAAAGPGALLFVVATLLAGGIFSGLAALRARRLRELRLPYGVAIAAGACAYAVVA